VKNAVAISHLPLTGYFLRSAVMNGSVTAGAFAVPPITTSRAEMLFP